MKQLLALLTTLACVLALAAGCTPYHAQGITAGALTGGAIGAAVNHSHPWTGAAVGAAAGGLLGGVIADANYRQYYGPNYYGYGYSAPQGYYYAPPRNGYYYGYPRY